MNRLISDNRSNQTYSRRKAFTAYVSPRAGFRLAYAAAALIALLITLSLPHHASAAPGDPTDDSSAGSTTSTTSTTLPRETGSTSQSGDVTVVPSELDVKQASADAIAQELDRFGTELEIAAEEFNKAREELVETEANIDAARRRLDDATSVFEKRREVYSERMTSMYKNGGTQLDFLEVLLETTSFADFLSRLNYMMQIASADNTLIGLLEADQATMNEQIKVLEDFRQKQEETQRQVQEHQAKIQTMINDRQALLDGVESEIREILKQDEAQKSEAQKAFVEELKKKASVAPTSQLRSMLDPSSVVSTALQYLGTKYVWGGETPSIGLDCSGLSLVVFREHGVKLRHYSGWQYADAPIHPEKSELIPGDIVFYGSPIHHMGIYIGDGYYVHAPRTGDVVKISSIERPDWAGAARYPLKNKE